MLKEIIRIGKLSSSRNHSPRWSATRKLICGPLSFSRNLDRLVSILNQSISSIFALPIQANRSPNCPLTRERLYTLRTHGLARGEADFYTGVLADGRQALMGSSDTDKLVCITFSKTGDSAKSMIRSLPKFQHAHSKRKGKLNKETSLQVQQEWRIQHLRDWQDELGWHPQAIHVLPFMLEVPVYIASLPTWGYTVRYDPYVYTDQKEREELIYRLDEWEKSGRFVFWWGNDNYFMDSEGNVIST